MGELFPDRPARAVLAPLAHLSWGGGGAIAETSTAAEKAWLPLRREAPLCS